MTLEQLRKQNNLTQTDLAELLGVSQSCIGNYEQGTRRPRPELMQKIADLFGLSAQERWDMFYYSTKAPEAPATPPEL